MSRHSSTKMRLGPPHLTLNLSAVPSQSPGWKLQAEVLRPSFMVPGVA